MTTPSATRPPRGRRVDALIDAMVASGTRRLLDDGEVLCRENDTSDEAYVVVDGAIEASVVGHAGAMTVATHGAGSIVGEVTHVVHAPAGTTIFRQEDGPDYVYVIESGEVEIVRELIGGDEERLATLGPGQYFGELGAMLGFPRSATARASTDVALTAMPPHEFRAKLERA